MTDAAPQNSPELLATCPFCGYALEGLPVEHRCPECGNAVDRRWRVFGGVRKMSTGAKMLILGLGFHVSIAVSAVFIVVAMQSSWRSLFRLRFEWFLPVAVAAAIGIAIWFQQRMSRAFVAITDDGVLLFRRPPKFERLGWDEIRRVKQEVAFKRIAFETTRGVIHFSTTAFGFDTDLLYRCEYALRARVDAYNARRWLKTATDKSSS